MYKKSIIIYILMACFLFSGCMSTKSSSANYKNSQIQIIEQGQNAPDDIYKNIPRRPLSNENDFIDYCISLIGKPLPDGYVNREENVYTRTMINEIDKTSVVVVVQTNNNVVTYSSFGMNTENYSLANSFCDFYRDYIIAKGFKYDNSYYSPSNNKRYYNNSFDIVILTPNINGNIINTGLSFGSIQEQKKIGGLYVRDGFDILFEKYFSLFGTKVTNYMERTYNGSFKIDEFYSDDIQSQFNVIAFLDQEQKIKELNIIVNYRTAIDGVYLIESLTESNVYKNIDKLREGRKIFGNYLSYYFEIYIPELDDPLVIFIVKR